MDTSTPCKHNDDIVHVPELTTRRHTRVGPEKVIVYGSDEPDVMTESWFECTGCRDVVELSGEIRFS